MSDVRSPINPRVLRTLTRIAWRDARRNVWRTVLVVAMIAIPIAALTMGSVAVATGAPTPDEYATGQLGDADVVVHYVDEEGVAAVAAGLPEGSRYAVVRSMTLQTVVDGGISTVAFEAADADADLVEGRYVVIEGRRPWSVDEVALAPQVLDEFGLAIGDRFTTEAPPLDLEVVGAVVRPEELSTPLGLTLPGALPTAETGITGMFITLPGDAAVIPDAISDSGAFSTRAAVEAETSIGGTIPYRALVTLVLLGLVETGLIVAAAFVVGARRQLRSLGLVGAGGGCPRQVRAIMLSAGVVLGVIGSSVGVVLGVLGGIAITPQLESILDRITGDLVIPVPTLAIAVLLGTATAVLAAWGPARSVARLTTLDALAARTPPPPSALRTAGVGIALVIAGGVVLAVGTIMSSISLLTVGLILMLGGVLLAIPMVVSSVGRLAGRMPLALRIAGRDAGRHGRRTGAAVAAATLALALPLAVSTLTLSQNAGSYTMPQLAPDHLVVDSLQNDDQSRRQVAESVASQIDTVAVGETRLATPDPDRYSLWTDDVVEDPDGGGTVTPPGFGGELDVERGDVQVWAAGLPRDEDELEVFGGPLLIGNEQLLAALHADHMTDELAAGNLVAIGTGVIDNGLLHVELPPERPADPDADWQRLSLPAAESGGPEYPAAAAVVISERRAAELGLIPGVSNGTVIRTVEPMQGEALTAARTAAAQVPGGSVWSLEDSQPGGGLFLTVLLAFAAAVALATIGVAVALVAAESRRDQAVLSSVGAGPGTRRKIVASNALLVAVMAAVLAVPAGILPVAVLQTARSLSAPVVMPWTTLIAVVIVVPLIAGGAAGLLSRPTAPNRMLHPVN